MHITAKAVNRRRILAAGEGFTLLELLISLTLFVLIVVIAAGAMRLAGRSVAGGEKKMDAQERFRTVLSLIDAQIQSHLPLTYPEGENKTYGFAGDRKFLRFPSGYSIWNGQRGYVIVEYRIEPAGSGNDLLTASEQIPGIDGRLTTRLLEAADISFDYFYTDPTTGEKAWLEGLPARTAVPEQVRIHLNSRKSTFTRVFPVRIREGITPVPKGGSL